MTIEVLGLEIVLWKRSKAEQYAFTIQRQCFKTFELIGLLDMSDISALLGVITWTIASLKHSEGLRHLSLYKILTIYLGSCDGVEENGHST